MGKKEDNQRSAVSKGESRRMGHPVGALLSGYETLGDRFSGKEGKDTDKWRMVMNIMAGTPNRRDSTESMVLISASSPHGNEPRDVLRWTDILQVQRLSFCLIS